MFAHKKIVSIDLVLMSTAATPTATATASADTKGTAKPTKPRAPKAKKTNKTVDPKVICEQFAQQVMDRYQLENDVMSSMSEVVLAVLNNYHIYNDQQTVTVGSAADPAGSAGTAGGKGKKGKVAEASDKPKKPRKSSAYNVYVKEMMQDPKVKTVPQKEKMTIIGNMWKALPEADRAQYQTKATELNATLGDDAETATQVTTN